MTVLSDRVVAAREFAIAAHGDQKYSEHPYVYHLDKVAALLSGYGPVAEIVGYLHDVAEDTPTTPSDIAKAFGSKVAVLVSVVTDCKGKNRKERKAATNAKFATLPECLYMALVVKVADRLANVRECVDHNPSMLKMYQREHQAFKAAVYRQGIAEEMWGELDRLIVP